MRRKIALLAAWSALVATTALGQFVDNGGEAGSADTSAFGQSAEFSNVTTTFDGMEFRLKRLIRDPAENQQLKLVAEIVNLREDDRWIYFLMPAPRLIDDLGNEYWTTSWAGVQACTKYGDWATSTRDCSSDRFQATRAAPNVGVTVVIGFIPSDTGTFDTELSKLATSGTATVHFVVSEKDTFGMSSNDIEAVLKFHSIVIPQIPLPVQQ